MFRARQKESGEEAVNNELLRLVSDLAVKRNKERMIPVKREEKEEEDLAQERGFVGFEKLSVSEFSAQHPDLGVMVRPRLNQPDFTPAFFREQATRVRSAADRGNTTEKYLSLLESQLQDIKAALDQQQRDNEMMYQNIALSINRLQALAEDHARNLRDLHTMNLVALHQRKSVDIDMTKE